MRNLDFIYFDAGAGHRSAATALKMVIEQQKRPWNVRLINLQELLDEMDIIRKYTGVRLQDQYNRLLKNGWTLGSEYLIPPMQALIRMLHNKQVRLLTKFWREGAPDLVVSLIPHFNRALLQGVKGARPDAELLTILTDIADFPPHFWLERQEQYVVCGSEKAVEQATAVGQRPERILRASGMILHPRFYEPIDKDPREERRRLGLDPDKRTGVVLFGGHGSPAMKKITENLDQAGLYIQLILVCGHSQALADELRAMKTRIPKFVEGFTKEIPYYMHISDFFIGKPGPGSISEALQMKLPVIVERNAWTLPQERYNTEWVQERGVGIVVPNMGHVATAVQELLAADNFGRFCEKAAAYKNRAIFEIPEMIDGILSR
ncbi:MAG: galactosyldiacylglycerol synthase [Bryobacteraceae bacterium]